MDGSPNPAPANKKGRLSPPTPKTSLDTKFHTLPDLSKFFDTVNHSKLLQLLSDKLKDGRVVSLIHKILRAPIQEGDKIMPCEIGTPQGGPVSPVLANIMLNELDHELERRGHRFVRYADDMMIFCRSRKAAERTLRHLKPYVEGKLFLKLNEQA